MHGFLKTVVVIGISLFAVVGIARADECHLSWDIPCCPVPGTNVGTASVVLTICNSTDIVSNYTWDFPPQPPLSFTPAMGMVALAPGECVDIPITVTCPEDFATPGNGVVFTVVIENATTGTATTCQGSIRNTGDIKANPTPPVVTVDMNGPIDVGVLVTNTSDVPVLWDPIFEVMPQTDDIVVAPFEPVVIPARASMHKNFRVNRIDFSSARGGVAPHEPFVFYDIILSWDQDGDGSVEPGSSVAIRSIRGNPCAADFNGDGVIDSGDLARLLASWGPCP